jgi:hypothetical protein
MTWTVAQREEKADAHLGEVLECAQKDVGETETTNVPNRSGLDRKKVDPKMARAGQSQSEYGQLGRTCMMSRRPLKWDG